MYHKKEKEKSKLPLHGEVANDCPVDEKSLYIDGLIKQKADVLELKRKSILSDTYESKNYTPAYEPESNLSKKTDKNARFSGLDRKKVKQPPYGEEVKQESDVSELKRRNILSGTYEPKRKNYRADVSLDCQTTEDFPSNISTQSPTHPNDGKLFYCQFCHKRFDKKIFFIAHMRNRRGDKPYKCEKCGKDFTIKQYLDSHLKWVHNTDKRFPCHVCNLKFHQQTYLTKHLKTHSNEKPFKCLLCAKHFAYNYSRMRHYKNIHGIRLSKEICKDIGKP